MPRKPRDEYVGSDGRYYRYIGNYVYPDGSVGPKRISAPSSTELEARSQMYSTEARRSRVVSSHRVQGFVPLTILQAREIVATTKSLSMDSKRKIPYSLMVLEDIVGQGYLFNWLDNSEERDFIIERFKEAHKRNLFGIKKLLNKAVNILIENQYLPEDFGHFSSSIYPKMGERRIVPTIEQKRNIVSMLDRLIESESYASCSMAATLKIYLSLRALSICHIEIMTVKESTPVDIFLPPDKSRCIMLPYYVPELRRELQILRGSKLPSAFLFSVDEVGANCIKETLFYPWYRDFMRQNFGNQKFRIDDWKLAK